MKHKAKYGPIHPRPAIKKLQSPITNQVRPGVPGSKMQPRPLPTGKRRPRPLPRRAAQPSPGCFLTLRRASITSRLRRGGPGLRRPRRPLPPPLPPPATYLLKHVSIMSLPMKLDAVNQLILHGVRQCAIGHPMGPLRWETLAPHVVGAQESLIVEHRFLLPLHGIK